MIGKLSVVAARGLLALAVGRANPESPAPGVLSDSEIWDEIAYSDFDVHPLQPEQVQPASIDLRLGSDFKRLKEDKANKYSFNDTPSVIDTGKDTEQAWEEFEAEEVVLEPGDCVLGTTKETVNIPPHLLGEVEGRSSIGRLFVEVHKTAGVVDPGYRGEITLEIHNDNPNPVKLHEGQRVCQMLVKRLNRPAENPYGEKTDSKYQGQTGATASRLHQDL